MIQKDWTHSFSESWGLQASVSFFPLPLPLPLHSSSFLPSQLSQLTHTETFVALQAI